MLSPKLIQPGWAGDLTPEELTFIKKELKADRKLRAKWGMGHGHGYVNDEKIRRVAMDGVHSLQEMPILAPDRRFSVSADFGGQLR